MDKKQEERLKFYAKEIERNNKIKKEVYENYNIKRGLRNKNGTGVLVGVTQVGDVSGYKIIDNKKIPSRGELYYRGYPLTEIVEDIDKDKRLGFEEIIYSLANYPMRQSLNLLRVFLSKKESWRMVFLKT